ncbi:hypothetical protein FB451DRAFT_1196750 [Mycena latifolia]|nr:hypothetical protein FB451DRAFT_1196750 [Mycena latifolia]
MTDSADDSRVTAAPHDREPLYSASTYVFQFQRSSVLFATCYRGALTHHLSPAKQAAFSGSLSSLAAVPLPESISPPPVYNRYYRDLEQAPARIHLGWRRGREGKSAGGEGNEGIGGEGRDRFEARASWLVGEERECTSEQRTKAHSPVLGVNAGSTIFVASASSAWDNYARALMRVGVSGSTAPLSYVELATTASGGGMFGSAPVGFIVGFAEGEARARPSTQRAGARYVLAVAFAGRVEFGEARDEEEVELEKRMGNHASQALRIRASERSKKREGSEGRRVGTHKNWIMHCGGSAMLARWSYQADGAEREGKDHGRRSVVPSPQPRGSAGVDGHDASLSSARRREVYPTREGGPRPSYAGHGWDLKPSASSATWSASAVPCMRLAPGCAPDGGYSKRTQGVEEGGQLANWKGRESGIKWQWRQVNREGRGLGGGRSERARKNAAGDEKKEMDDARSA